MITPQLFSLVSFGLLIGFQSTSHKFLVHQRRENVMKIFIDYKDLDSVIALAKKLNSPTYPQVAYKNPMRPNYNITHASRTDLYKPEWVVWSGKKGE